VDSGNQFAIITIQKYWRQGQVSMCWLQIGQYMPI